MTTSNQVVGFAPNFRAGKTRFSLLLAVTACAILVAAQQSFRASAAQRKEVTRASANNLPCDLELAPIRMQVPGGVIDVSFAPGKFDLPVTSIQNWIKRAAIAVSTYYGRFPVFHARVRVVPVEGEDGIYHATTFGDNGGFTRIPVGEHTTEEEFESDWIMTHEFVHLAFPDMQDVITGLKKDSQHTLSQLLVLKLGSLIQ